MSIRTEVVRNALIEEAAEDYVGVYEIVWDLASNAPDVAVDQRVEIARQLVEEMIAQHGAVLFVTTEWPPTSWRPVERDQWPSVLSNPLTWVSPESSTSPDLFWIAI